MSQFVNDTFSGQSSGDDLSIHVGETGATWTVHGSSAASSHLLFDASGRIYSSGASNALYYASGTPGNADQTVSVVLNVVTSGLGAVAQCPCARLSTSANTMYLVQYIDTTPGIRLFKIVAGAATQLSTTTTYTLVDGDTLTVSAIGTAISGIVNGVTKVGPVTDSAIAAANAVGIRGGNAFAVGTGYHATSFTADDTTSSAGIIYTQLERFQPRGLERGLFAGH